MRIALVLPALTGSNLRLARQIGVTDIVAGLPTGPGGAPCSLGDLLALRKRVQDAGLALSVIESMPVPDRVRLGQPGRDEEIDLWCGRLRDLGAAGIRIVCYDWMAVFGWQRTSTTTRVRGGALATSYEHELMQRKPAASAEAVTEEQLWDSLGYFMRAVVPVAEESQVKLAMHPDDPPLSPIRGVGRIMTSPDSFQRLIDMVPSPVNGITFCQGCFSEMGTDIPSTIGQFCRQGKVFFAHFRNLRGTAESFYETFHDTGDTDMLAAMKAYLDGGFDGPIRPDHVPALEGDDNSRPGYSLMGRLYAVGYMRGLIEAVEKGWGDQPASPPR